MSFAFWPSPPRSMARGLGRQLGAGADPGRREGEHGRAAQDDLVVADPVPAGLDQDPQGDRGAGHPVVAGLGEHPHEDLVGVQGPQDRAAAVDQGEELAAGQARRGAGPPPGRCRRAAGGPRPGGGARPAGGPPARRPAACGPRGSGSASRRGVDFGWISPASLRSMATCPWTTTTTSVLREVGRRGRARQQHRLLDGLAQRRGPEVALQLGQRLREGLGHRPRPVDRTLGARPGSRS